jgi:hypothetical protein
MRLTEKFTDRHPSTVAILGWLEPNQNLPLPGLTVANQVEILADMMVSHCSDGPELTTGLRKLLEAKDWFVRAAIAGMLP